MVRLESGLETHSYNLDIDCIKILDRYTKYSVHGIQWKNQPFQFSESVRY
jgi:hypothetical protein